MNIILCFLATLGLSQAAVLKFEPNEQQAMKWPPSFCNGLDCPKFQVLNSTEKYEARKYDVSKWVTTELSGVDYSSATYTMFMKLFNYISGNNRRSQKIAMTVPVISRIIPGQGPACESNFTMSFYLAIDNPPQPNATDVYLSELPQDLVAYVKGYGGWQTQSKFLKYASELAQELPTSFSYHKDFYYVAGYDSPFKLFNRHNEVWFIKK